jgi:hypothetical protein
MPLTSIKVIATGCNDVIDFEASLPTSATATSLHSTPAVVTTTAATTTVESTNTTSLDIYTIARDPPPITLWSWTLLHLSRECVANQPVGFLHEALEIATWDLTPQSTANFMFQIYDLLGDITNMSNAKVTWLSNFVRRNLAWK